MLKSYSELSEEFHVCSHARLLLGSQSPLSELISQYGMVDRFQQSWPEGGVDAEGGVHNLFGDRVCS